MREIEVKFKVNSFSKIQRLLKTNSGNFLGQAIEKTLLFETPKKSLRTKGLALRIRTGFKNTLTLKRIIKSRGFKEREEIELEISSPQKMERILKSLDLIRLKIMEKVREKWRIGNCEVVLDKLPRMGNFLEIEGNKKSIKKVAKILGLNFQKRIVITYWDLWDDFCKKKGIKSKNIVFLKRQKRQKF